jgi:hypothetical protein
MAGVLFLVLSGFAVTFGPFHAAIQWGVLVHTLIGLTALGPIIWYLAVHWSEYRRCPMSANVLLGYFALATLGVCLFSGVVVTWQGLFGIRMAPVWRNIHLISSILLVAGLVPHLVLAFLRVRKLAENAKPAWGYFATSMAGAAGGVAAVALLTAVYSGTRYVNEFPDDYHFLFGENRPFAPSLAQTDSGGAFDPRSLAGSKTCGTAGCHEQIVEEWLPSAHRYAAMDSAFQGIQEVMARENGAESTRYCAGCHDPISLFSGTKNLFVDNLTSLHGYQEGVSCLACHAIRDTDVMGNASYTMTQPREYLWQWIDTGIAKTARDFLIRTYPDEHNKLSKRLYKTSEYCGACHKQFIDQEVNRVGWVQLQNQYDNWSASHWNQEGDATKTVECRECHMPLVPSRDPASGDSLDYNRNPKDGKHRSHRFLASNQLIPELLQLEGWEEHTELTIQWLQGKFPIPEIEDKWADGPIVKLQLHHPETIAPGESIPLRVVLASNKVGHDFPTGPLDIIQSWIQVEARDDQGNLIFSSGTLDENNFIEPGSFLFKAEPVDQYGNLIDRHNLWEMVGVRYRRALFPGYSDTVQYHIPCPSSSAGAKKTAAPDEISQEFEIPNLSPSGSYHIAVSLQYRKIDQFLLNYLFGEDNKITSPVTELVRETAIIPILPQTPTALETSANAPQSAQTSAPNTPEE